MTAYDDALDALEWTKQVVDVECRFCGKKGLTWYPTEHGRFYLFDEDEGEDGGPHRCATGSRGPATADDFEDLS